MAGMYNKDKLFRWPSSTPAGHEAGELAHVPHTDLDELVDEEGGKEHEDEDEDVLQHARTHFLPL